MAEKEELPSTILLKNLIKAFSDSFNEIELEVKDTIQNNEDAEYIKRKKECIEDLEKDENYAIEKFDTLIVSLSSGGLVFSVGFIKDIIKNFEKIDLFWLKVCWVAFGLSLILNLISHVTSFYSNRYERKALKGLIKLRQKKSTELNPNRLQAISDKFDLGTTWLNGIGLFSFFTAVITLVYFINYNV